MFSLVAGTAKSLRDLRPALDTIADYRMVNINLRLAELTDLLEERTPILDYRAPSGGHLVRSTIDPILKRVGRLAMKAMLQDTTDLAFEAPLIEKDINNVKDWINLVCEEVARARDLPNGVAAPPVAPLSTPARPAPVPLQHHSPPYSRSALMLNTESHFMGIQAGHASPVLQTPPPDSATGNSLSLLLSPPLVDSPEVIRSRPTSVITAGSARAAELASNLPLRSKTKGGANRNTPPHPWLISTPWNAPAPWPATKDQELLVVLSIGASTSGASVTHLQPDTTPRIRLVTKWPSASDPSTIPTETMYNMRGTPVASGVKVNDATWIEALDKQELVIAKYSSKLNIDNITGSEQVRVSLETFFIHFIEHLLEEVKRWWHSESMPPGTPAERVSELWPKSQIVVTSGDGWKQMEINELKRAVVTFKKHRMNGSPLKLNFVEDGLAKCHFCLAEHEKGSKTHLSINSRLAVLDATDTFVSLRTYTVHRVLPSLILNADVGSNEETDLGRRAIFDSMNSLLQNKLSHSRFAPDTWEHTQNMMEDFNANLDRYDGSESERDIVMRLKFGFYEDSDASAGITRGKVTITGGELRRVFEQTAETLEDAIRRCHKKLSLKFLALSGVAYESPYLREKCTSLCNLLGIEVLRSREPIKSASRHGAALWFIAANSAVSTLYDIGLAISTPCSEVDDSSRVALRELHSSGKMFAPGGYVVIVPKGAELHRDSSFTKRFWVHAPASQSPEFSASVIAYSASAAGSSDGDSGPWSSDSTGCLLPRYYDCGTLSADFTAFVSGPAAAPMLCQDGGKPYRQIHFKVVICLDEDLQNLCAYVSWTVQGKEVHGPKTRLKLRNPRSPSLEVARANGNA